MWQWVRRIVVLGVLSAAALAAAVPAAWASVAPTIALDQSAGTAAGSFANLGVDLKFSPSSGDSPKQLTLNLPPGLLANASIDGGACLASADLTDTACQVGSGVVTADVLGIPVPTPVTFDLVPPPATGDLAGLAVNSNGSQIGSTGDIRIRPSGDPDGVGVTINMVLPNSLSGLPISITEISSTFDGLRYPTTCPPTPQSFGAAVNSYSDQTTFHTVSAPLSVTACSALPYSPAFSVTAVHDSGDDQVAVSTTVTQQATEAPSRSVSLLLPNTALSPNIQSITALCTDVSSGTCMSLGSVTADSPLYPRPLTGQAFVTGNFAHPSLTLVFPSPFPLTLTGTIDLDTNATTFTGLPDIPLTNLTVSLAGGPKGVFGTLCKSPSATATATLTDQNGDRTVTAPANFTISGCPAGGSHPSGKPRVTNVFLSGLRSGHPSLGFRISVPNGSAALHGLALVLPKGLRFVGKRVRVSGAKVGSVRLVRGRLVIRLRKPARSLTLRIGSGALAEASALKAKVKAGKARRLVLTLIATRATGARNTLHIRFKHPGR